MTKQEIIENFVQKFILKNKRERSLFELTHPQKRNLFSDRLNDNWENVFDINKLTLIPRNDDIYEFVKNKLKIKGTDLCYVISNYDDTDDKFMDFEKHSTNVMDVYLAL